MEISNSSITEQQKNATAIRVMRSMLTTYATEKQISFDELLLQFSKSNTYEVLFDFETGVWREGPYYLRALYEEELSKTETL